MSKCPLCGSAQKKESFVEKKAGELKKFERRGVENEKSITALKNPPLLREQKLGLLTSLVPNPKTTVMQRRFGL